MTRIDEIRSRLAAATPGEWEISAKPDGWVDETNYDIGPDNEPPVALVHEGLGDAEFIAASSGDVGFLLGVVEALTVVTDERVERVAEAIFETEYPAYSEAAVADSNRWSWRGCGDGCGHGEEQKNGYRQYARAALEADTRAVLSLLGVSQDGEV